MMSEIDLFANQLLEEAKRFLEKAREGEDETGVNANLHAALILSFCSLEAHINAIGDEFSIRPDLSVQSKNRAAGGADRVHVRQALRQANG
jgi:hypothetical protein